MKIKCIIIEDEKLAAEKLAGFIEKISVLELVSTFKDSISAINFLKSNSVDLVFLDIEMKDFNGIQFLKALQVKPSVIITSAYEKYAIAGYEFSVVDYLLKPYTLERFLQSVDKAINLKELKEKAINYELIASQSNEYIFIKSENHIEKVELDDILYIEGMKDYLRIHTPAKKIMTLQSFNRILEHLPDKKFKRVHNSFVIALNKIESIERNRIKIGETLIPISDKYKDSFFSSIKS
ncbi:MAG TPA: LytTR family DNA-binding domain-containing protein [Tenuifilaceae bacterium]|nr:LytTR family DNA-binding domain-containing protein [Tenuifilaceae bacterium]